MFKVVIAFLAIFVVSWFCLEKMSWKNDFIELKSYDYKYTNGVQITKSLYLSKIKKNFHEAQKSCEALGISSMSIENEDHYKKLIESIESAEPRIQKVYTAYLSKYADWRHNITNKEPNFQFIFHKINGRYVTKQAVAIEYKNDEYLFSEVEPDDNLSFICESIEISPNNHLTISMIVIILLLLCVIFIFAYKKYPKNSSVTPAVVEEQP